MEVALEEVSSGGVAANHEFADQARDGAIALGARPCAKPILTDQGQLG
jgi:hypothetical protein